MKKIISCNVYKMFIESFINKDDYDIEYLEIGRHNEPHELNETLQNMINKSQQFEEIYLLYGICGNSIAGLYSDTAKLYVLRVHDCFATMLGSNKRYFDLVRGNGSYQWKCASNANAKYLDEQYKEFCDLYGEENAEYLISIYGKKTDVLYYVNFDREEDKQNIDDYSKDTKVVVLEGSLDMLKRFFSKDPAVSLLVNGKEKIECVYDETEIIKKVQK